MISETFHLASFREENSSFPRLSQLLARDHFLPHQFAFRGNRLAFSTGIIFLAALSILLLIVFNDVTTALINLYAVGVFFSFTLSHHLSSLWEP